MSTPLHLWFQRGMLRDRGRKNGKVAMTRSLAVLLAMMWMAGTVFAQEAAAGKDAPAAVAAPQAAPVEAPPIKFRERPRYPADPQRLKRTPLIDGVLGDGEWDPFYTVTDGLIKGTVYCNWDDNFLYLATRTEGAANVLFDLDLNGDGWLRGADNVELIIGSVANGGTPVVSARLLDASNTKDTPVWNETAIDPKSIIVAEKLVNGTQILEIAIPKNTASLQPRVGQNFGLRAEFLPAGPITAFTSTAPFEPHLLLDATLAVARVTGVAGINPRLTLSDLKCIAGEKLFATLELTNQTDQTMPIKSVLWTGTGLSANVVNTLREVNVKPLPGLKKEKLTYQTVLPANLSVGSYLLSVTVELDGGKVIQSAAAFTVVEAIQVQMSSDPQPLVVSGQTKLFVDVDVTSAVPDHFRGDVELNVLPAGWQIDGANKRSLYIDREDAHRVARFNLKVPSTTAVGDYPVETIVTWRGQTWHARQIVKVIRTDAPAPPK
jgi:hypothetical protein